jgi:hypothetical protein
MSHLRARQLKLSLWHALLIAALPSACATEVQQEFDENGDPSGPSSGSGGALVTSGSGGVIPMPKAGSSTGGNGGSGVSPFGGTSSTGGKASAGTGGTDGEGGTDSGGSGGKATGGSGGASGGSGGASGGTGGGGSGTCGCMKTLAWADNTVLNWATGDCLTVADKTFKYVGTKMQTWANKDCNPTMQLAWCTDSGNDYKFMACP